MKKSILYNGELVDDLKLKPEFSKVHETIQKIYRDIPEIQDTYLIPKTIEDLKSREAIFRKIAKSTYPSTFKSP